MVRLTRSTETQLNTHDLELALSNGHDPRTGSTSSTRQLRALLLSRSAVSNAKLSDTFQRIHHFASLTGGEDLIILFLLNPPTGSTFVSAKELTKESGGDVAEAEAIAAYSKLQAELSNHSEIPYIPVQPILKLDDLPETIEKQVSPTKGKLQMRKPLAKSIELLRICTVNPPMAEQTAYFLSDIFVDLNDLASACLIISSVPSSSSPSARAAAFHSSRLSEFESMMNTEISDSSAAAKLKRLRDLAGEQECQDIIDFWKDEWLI